MLGTIKPLFAFILWAFAVAFFTTAGAAEKSVQDLFNEMEKGSSPPSAARGVKDLFDEMEKGKATQGEGGKVEDLFKGMEDGEKAAPPGRRNPPRSSPICGRISKAVSG